MKYSSFVFFLLAPVAAFAQTGTPLGNTVTQLMAIIQQLIPLMLALAVLVFFWGIVKFIANVSDDEKRKGGVRLMIWGMVALFVMVGFWGIIGYVQQTLGITGTVTPGIAPILSNPVPGN